MNTDERSLKQIRKNFKQNGVFYTSSELAEYMRRLFPDYVGEIYDPACGSGNLLAVFGEAKKYGQDIDESQINIAKSRLDKFEGYTGDTLKEPAFKGRKFEYIIANPPFSVKWEPKTDERFCECPELPPPSKADYAFILHCLYYLADGGLCVTVAFPGILYRGQREGKIRQWLVEKGYIEKIIAVPGGKFEDTSIATCILVLSKRKVITDIEFEDMASGLKRLVPLTEIQANSYNLSVSLYIQEPQEHIVIDPAAEETKARQGVIKRLNAELAFSKQVCEFERLDFNSFLDDLQKVIDEWRLKCS